MITFTQPVFLWGLFGIMVPLAIHLLSRAEGRVIKVGSIRHFEESATSRFKSIRLNEILLLLLRASMVALLAFFLSGMSCTTTRPHPRSWVLIEEGLEKNPIVVRSLDSLKTSGYEVRHLAAGFPEVDKDTTLLLDNYWHLIEMLAEQPLAQAVVFASGRASLFKAERVALPAHIAWVNVGTDAHTFTAAAYALPNGNYKVVDGASDEKSTLFETRILDETGWLKRSGNDQPPLLPLDTIRVAIQSNSQAKEDREILSAAVRALNGHTAHPIIIVESSTSHDFLFLINQYADEGGTSTTSGPLIRKIDGGWEITRKLTPTAALQEHLVIELAKIILPELSIDKRWDMRQMPEKMMFANEPHRTSVQNKAEDHYPLGNYLLALFGLVWFAERFWAMKRNQ
ncbi:MAG: BatA domain-containing protein [Cyclobacteriaceae bacterium]